MQIKTKFLVLFSFFLIGSGHVKAQLNAVQLVEAIKTKLNRVRSYEADALLKTNVAFIKAPVGKVKVYYKKPNQLRVEKEKGLSILPQGAQLFNPSSLAQIKDYDALDAGYTIINKTKLRKVRVLPRNADQDIVLLDLLIDEKKLLLNDIIITSKENGTFEMELFYNKYTQYMLPDKLVFKFNVKTYKMPKSLSLDFDEPMNKTESDKLKNKQGSVELTYSNYRVITD